ncbi:site-specific DNA-methyltransferase [Haemophilus parainfluenzae]|jgi:hypothetical protein|uniref:DNA methyltransferase n=1 Tax=Haemophilus parainfluenzae TaxID=729 RepID=UPI000C9A10B2|nr:site-specific DNA-methyltransferase [Haemophilus parainfluenzae]MDU5804860.1 site-specific DNA-methyltransferase [Haemophilus parainfluenzae]MDU5822839.1 site-specific DNA-methyltransferase [Haemophilus parainfluenzae]MDU5839849.1 site-specific DNA-methyltransferase [Haemophilus parainfluenzae]PMC55914.1 site-specific DNA-methyltransferase [Haemophilus parainfluenzae]
MNKNIFEIVEEILKTNSKYLSEEGKLLKAVVYSDIMGMDKELLSLLLSQETIKKRFFQDINGTLVFDKQKFAWFIESKEFLPDSYTRYTSRVGLTHNGDFISKSNDVVLDFPYKDCVLEGGQDKEDQKREEIFYHETIASDEISKMLAPKVFTNVKRYTKDGIEENITFDEKDNLIIKGNNLIALSSLLKRYEGKVKCIYIDPPFNTDKDGFNYNDKFPRSSWLIFMKNRLELAKRLLDEKGNILVQVDWHQAHYLKVLMDDIFGEKFFNNEIIWHYSSGGDYKNSFAKKHDTIFSYSKSEDNVFFPNNMMVGEKRGTKKKNNMKKNIDSDGKIYFSIKSAGKEYKYYEDDIVIPDDVWDLSILHQKDPERVGFLSQKPEKLIARIVGAFTNNNDIILDYHVGSGTTCAVAHKMGRRYIGVEQMDYIENITVERMKKVIDGEQGGISKAVDWQGGGSFVYCELLENASTLIEKIQSASEETIFEIKSEIYADDRIVPYITRAELEKANKEFTSLELEDKKKILISLVDKNKLYVNYSDMDDENYAVNEQDKAFTESFYAEV